MTEGFDDGQTYETAEGTFPKRAEIFFSANYFSMDEEATSDAERTCDRLAVIPFGEWNFMTASEFSKRQNLFKNVVDCEARPTELVIGEIGSFLNSEEFQKKRESFGAWLYEKAEVVKIRTLLNYGSFYAIHWKLYEIFQSEWDKLGYSWAGFEEWVENVHVPFLVGQHMEVDHSIHAIRRYINGLLGFVSGMSDTEILKFMKICQTSKTKSKHVLAIHPDKRYPDLKQLGHIKLLDVKKHLPSVGGIWDDTTYATLLRTDVDDLDTTQNVKNDMVAKRALLIPISIFTSSQIMKICDITGQKEYYSLADSETPSGVDEACNSTSLASSSQPRLALTDVSSIHVPSNVTLDEVSIEDQIFEDRDMTLTRINDDDLSEHDESKDSEESNDSSTEAEEEYLCSICALKLDSLPNLITHMQNHQKESKKKKVPKRKPEVETYKCDECQESFTRRADLKEHVRNQHPLAEDEFATQDSTVKALEAALTEKNVHDNSSGFRKSMKSNSNRSISLVDESYICECGFSSNSKSGATRHKCHKEKLLIKCTFCEKYCGNAGSLKLHIRAKHKDMQARTANDAEKTVEAAGLIEEEEESRQNPKSVNNASTTQKNNSKSKNNVEMDSNSKEMEAVKEVKC